MSDQKWAKVIAGIATGISIYGWVKCARGEKWTPGGIIGSGLAGGVGLPILEPGIRKLIDKLRSLPPSSQPVFQAGNIRSNQQENSPPEIQKKMVAVSQNLPKAISSSNAHTLAPSSYRDMWADILAPGSVILIVGKRGSGKSALGYFLLEKLCYRMNCYAVNLPKPVHHLLPQEIGVTSSLKDAPFDSALFLDEAALQFPARMSTQERNKKLLEIISLARQRNQIIIFVAQETSYVDVNILRGLSTLIVKEPSPLQGKFERTNIRELIQKARKAFDQVAGDKRGWAYVAFSPTGYEGMLEVTKPSFFTDELSRCYSLFGQGIEEKKVNSLPKKEKKEKAYEWHTKDHLSIRQIARRLGVSKSTVHNWIKEITKREQKDEDTLEWLLSQCGQGERN